MQKKGYEAISNAIKSALKDFFKNGIGTFTLSYYTDTPYTEFKMEFMVYNYFNVILDYDRGRFGCSIINGSNFIPLENSQKWYDQADINIFLKELDQQLKLRIPDKYLEFHGWK